MCRILVLAVLVLLADSATGQTLRTLTLQQSIELAQSQSPAAASARLSFDQSYWDYRGFRSRHLPTVFLSADAPGLRRSIEELDQDDGTVRYVERNSTFGQARISISQPILWTGGQLFVSSRLSRLNNRFAETDFTQWQQTQAAHRGIVLLLLRRADDLTNQTVHREESREQEAGDQRAQNADDDHHLLAECSLASFGLSSSQARLPHVCW